MDHFFKNLKTKYSIGEQIKNTNNGLTNQRWGYSLANNISMTTDLKVSSIASPFIKGKSIPINKKAATLQTK